MSCSKCNEVFTLDEKEGVLFFICEIDELVSKSEKFLKSLSLKSEYTNGLLYTKVDNVSGFFNDNLEIFREKFTALEMAEIKIFISKDKDNFNFQDILKAKPMQRYVNLFDDKDFFGHIYGYEALTRGVKEDGELMYPDILFTKSSRNDFNFKLDRLCRESALKTAATKKVHQKVFINFIPTAIYDPEFCLKSTEKWANQLEFDPSQIVFEVVETEQVGDQAHLKNILEYYREKGFKIALDDVGEGYSSLNMLIELKPDIIKIDRNIITDIDTNELKQSTYKALYNLAKENGIIVLAEGIETKAELDMIKSIGVDLAQGYYFAKPTPEPIRKLVS